MSLYDPNTSLATQHFCRSLGDHIWSYREEARRIPHNKYVAWHEDIYDGDWGVYAVRWQGKDVDSPLAPFLRKIVGLSDGLVVSAGYSRLGPKTEIEPHAGYSSAVLRCHLPLIIPEGDVGLRVGDTTVIQEVGRAYLFDDTQVHSAWNRTGRQRVVLIADLDRALIEQHKLSG